MTDKPSVIDTQNPPILADFMTGYSDHMMSNVPYSKALDLQLVRLSRDVGIMKVPYHPNLIGNPDTGVVHGGVISTLLDHTSGLSVMCALKEFRSMATLDLRIDYMQAAEPERDIFALCHCYRVTARVAFVRGTAYHDVIDDPIATSTASFMLGNANWMMKAKGGETEA
jgi:uncharacterized protein (TIGR00369 family)